MSWHYRVLRHPDGWLALHEVYCDEDGKPNGYTVNPASFGADAEEGLSGIIGALKMALADAERRPIMDTADFDPQASAEAEAPPS